MENFVVCKEAEVVRLKRIDRQPCYVTVERSDSFFLGACEDWEEG